MIPPECQDTSRAAETAQYEEHLKYNTLAPLSVEESRAVRKDKPERVLRCRFAYLDKHWSKRKAQPDLGWKPKSRLVIGGHGDPDLHRANGIAPSAVPAPSGPRQQFGSGVDRECRRHHCRVSQRTLHVCNPRFGVPNTLLKEGKSR